MSDRYEPYCLADPLFYDSLAGTRGDGLDFAAAGRETPAGWRRYEDDEWLSLRPQETQLPMQGWKIHVAACLDNAERVLTSTWDYCVQRGVAFKFLRGRHVLHMRNAKYAYRGSSGKFITLYPADTDEFEGILSELGSLLRGEPGPYILSDLRWDDGPLYVRYGGFFPRYCHSTAGERVPAIEQPDGRLVPDRRDAVFAPPEWVAMPHFLEPALENRNRTTVAELPYRIHGVLHFSNGGGLYRAEDSRDGTAVVLKEARPHAGLSSDGADAVTRLRRERSILDRLAGIEGIPVVHDYFLLGEHEFLVLDYVEGVPLNKVYAEKYPLGNRNPGKAELAEYTCWALTLYDGLSEIIASVHERNVVYGDLHLFNVLIRPDGRPVLVDFEVASGLEEQRRPVLANPGFATPAHVAGLDIDRHALACLGLALFLPMTELIRLDVGKTRQLAEAVAKHFPVPRRFIDDIMRRLEDPSEAGERVESIRRRPVVLGTGPDGWKQVRASLAAGIITSATPDREDRLFPGDIAQFTSGGLNIAHGAAGVLYALSVTGCGRYSSFEEWLTLRARRATAAARLGFFDGLHGVAYVLDHLGHSHQALEVLDHCLGQDWRGQSYDLFGGLSGMGLNLVHFAARTGDTAMLDTALNMAERMADGQGGTEDVPDTSGGQHPYAGLMWGASGRALLFLRLYEQTNDQDLLEHAATALRQDLRRCLRRPDGSMQVNEGWRTQPYLAEGSAGIGVVLSEYLGHREDEQFAEIETALRESTMAPFYVQSGLFRGRAGLIAYLSRRHPPGRAAADPEIAAHIRRLNWHALSYRGHLAFPGEQLLRLSMDLATGSAGVLLALGAAMHDRPVGLPLLEPATPTADTVRTGEFPAAGEGR